MSKCVLALVDIEFADNAVRLVDQSSSTFSGADLHVAHVIPFGFYNYIEPYISQESRDSMYAAAKSALDAILERTHAADASPHVLHGGIGEQALLLAEKIAADVIVLNATRPESAHTTLGTQAAQIARHARCSVFLAR